MSVRNFSFVVLGVATLLVGGWEGEIGDHTSPAGGALGWRWRYGRGGHGGTPSVAGNSGSVAGTGGSAQPTGIGGAGAGSQPTGVGGVGGTPTGTGNSAGGTAGTTGSGGTPT